MLNLASVLLVFLGTLPVLEIHAQIAEKKKVEATRTEFPPVIDARLDDPAWESAMPATGFIKRKPFNGDPATFDARIKFVYDDEALYVGAMLFDTSPDSIFTELSERDQENMADWFGIYIDCFNDYLTAYGFIVTAAGVQIDLKSTADSEDRSWDAVWESQTTLRENGWVAELKIPYSALRFPKTEKQLWGVQAFRNITRYREESTWNFINLQEEGLNNQAGELHGIENVNPPLRLSFVPYLSGYAIKSPETVRWGYSYNYGLDLKLGINESYTLDMTLVPDFGQVQSDDEIYNLSPFEVYYNERRPFFMEGTELFNKGNVFYSRRIGKMPSGYDAVTSSLEETEKITHNPNYSQLINATKISGKSSGKLAVGFFNGITANTYAEVSDTVTGQTREIMTEPLTNYNMLVFDQALPNNSFISLYNTNVYQPDARYSANVTGSEAKLTTRNNVFAIAGKGIVSQKYNHGFHPDFGYLYSISGGKISGKFTFKLSHDVIDDKYDPNDMGYLMHNNLFSQGLSLSYNIYKPTWQLLDSYNTLWFNYAQLNNPRTFTDFTMGFRSRNTLKNFLTIWINGNLMPVEKHDYYEPRNQNRWFIVPPSYTFSIGFSPDYKKRFLIDWNAGYTWASEYNIQSWSAGFKPRFRVNDKLMTIYNFSYKNNRNNIGYVTDSMADGNHFVIIFGARNIHTYENSLEANYKFTNRSSLAFRLRHYWITLTYTQFFNLDSDGRLSASDYNKLHDFSYNIFNIDMQYIWNFAAGSEIRIVWKNAINTYEEAQLVNSIINPVEDNYAKNFTQMLRSPATNSLSIKLLYYIDYQNIRRLIQKKK